MFLDYNFRNYNYRLFLYVLLLNITGVLIIRSASNQDISMVLKQIVGILVGLTAVIILSLVDYHKVVSVHRSYTAPAWLPSGCAGVWREQRCGTALAGASGHWSDPAV